MSELKEILDATQCPECKRLNAHIEVLESDDHEWYLQAEEIERLTAILEYANNEIKDGNKRIEKLEGRVAAWKKSSDEHEAEVEVNDVKRETD